MLRTIAKPHEIRQGNEPPAGSWWDVGALCLLGLMALGWFHRGFLIKTEDVALPFTLQRWWEYAHAWNHLIDAGVQFWENFPGLLFLALPAGFQAIGLSMGITQRLEYLVWFTLPGLSMYLLMCQVAPGPGGRVARLVASAFYMCNLYLEPVWQGMNIANLSAYAALPALLGLFIRGLRSGDWRTVPAIALVSLVGSGVGTNPPLMVVAAIPLPCYLLLDIITQRRWRRPQAWRWVVGYVCAVVVAVVAVNSFWILPQLEMFRGGAMAVTIDQAALQQVSRSWLQGTSAATHLLNLLRLQGHWVWFENRGNDPYVPYASLFQTNPWMLWASFLLPAIVWASLLGRIRTMELYFVMLALVGLLFGAGIHPPYGGLYNWMVGHVPYFWIIRSPWYKFTLLTCLGYAVLLGCFSTRFYQWGRRRFARRSWRTLAGPLAAGLPAGVVLLTMAYAFPVSLGKMYPTSADRPSASSLAPSHIHIPPYVREAAGWLNQQTKVRRVFILPGRRVFALTWGYTDYMPALTYFTSTPLVFDYPRAGGSAGGTSEILQVIKSALREGTTKNLQEILALLAVDTLLLEHDAVLQWHVDYADQPAQLVHRLEEQAGIVPLKDFGPWTFYQVHRHRPFFYLADQVTVVYGAQQALATLSNTELLGVSTIVFAHQQTADTLRWLFAHGLVHRVVGMNPPTGGLRDAVPWLGHTEGSPPPALELFYTSDQMETVLSQKASEVLRLSAIEGLSPPERFNGQEWRWLTTNNKPNIVVDNPTASWRYGNVGFQVYGFGRPRTLYTYLNGTLVSLQPTPTDGAVAVRLPRLRFRPGGNQLAFYAPEQHDIRQGRPTNFAFRGIVLEAPIIAQTVDIPLQGLYRMWWHIESPLEAPLDHFAEAVGIDNRTIPLTQSMVGGRPAYSSEPLLLSPGRHRVWCESSIGARMALRLSLVRASAVPTATEPSVVNARAVGPTRYEVTYHTLHPSLMVFSGGFHPRWLLRGGSGACQTPCIVNGFANGYLVSPSGPVHATLEFVPQRLFVFGSMLSGVALVGILIWCGYLARAARRRGAA